MSLTDENEPRVLPPAELVARTSSSADILFRIPEPPLPTIRRPRVHDLLDDAVNHPVTLVLGWAGTGKTIAVADWARQTAERTPVIWVSLTTSAANPGELWRRVGEAAAVLLGPPTPTVTAPPPGDDLDRAFHLLGALGRRQATLVVDDAHLITDQDTVDVLDDVLRHPPAGLRVVLVGRHAPQIHLQRLHVDGLLAEIGSRELAFTASEGAEALRMWGAALPPGTTEAVVAAVRGWPTGVRLAALAITAAEDPRAEATGFGLSHPSVAAFIQEELQHLPDLRRAVLVAAGMVKEISAPLAAALVGSDHAGEALADLARDSHVLPATPGWYRIRRSTRALLQQGLLGQEAVQSAELHRRAAEWFAAAGDDSAALEHALLAQAWDLAAPLLLKEAVSLTMSGSTPEVPQLVRAIPGHAVIQHPELMLATAWAEFGSGGIAQATDGMRSASRRLQELPEPRLGAARFAMHLLEAVMAHQRSDTPALLEAAGLADEVGGALSPTVGHVWLDLAGIAPRLRAVANLWAAMPDRVLELAESPATGDLASSLVSTGILWQGYVALAEALTGRLQQARARAETALGELSSRSAPPPRKPSDAAAFRSGPAWLALALAAAGQGDTPTADRAVALGLAANANISALVTDGLRMAGAATLLARDHLYDAREVLSQVSAGWDEQPVSPLLVLVHTAIAVELELAAGAPGRAAELLAQHDRRWIPDGEQDRPGLDYLDVLRSRVLDGRQPAPAMQSLLDPMLTRAGTMGCSAWLVLAQAMDARHEDAEATQALSRALDLAVVEGVLFPFLNPTPRLRSMLERHLEVLGTHREFIARVLAGESGAEPASVVTDPLTDRELSVLAYLPTLSSNDEIAEALNISVNTVKQHLKAIHRKLQVGTRREAVRVARRLDLLPRSGKPGPWFRTSADGAGR